jgi:hypothetical protein
MKRTAFALLLLPLFTSLFGFSAPAAAAGCTTLPQDKGQATANFTSKAGTFAVWARLLPGSQNDDSVLLTIDDKLCGVVVGDSNSLKVGEFTWINFRDGNQANKITTELSEGTHSLTIAGRETNVGIDKLMVLADTCTPTGTGDNCAQSDVVAAPVTPATHEQGTASTATVPSKVQPPMWQLIAVCVFCGLVVIGLGLFFATKRWPGRWHKILRRKEPMV